MDMRFSWLCVLLAVLPLELRAAPKTQVHLLLSHETARAGDTITAGVQLRMPPKWHTYWRNPGDSGSETSNTRQLPPGITPGDNQGPVPERFNLVPFTKYVYSGEVIRSDSLS